MSTDAPAAFISYSRNQSAFAIVLAKDLKRAGTNVWLDQLDIEPGQRWDNAVESALEDSRTVLVVLSRASVVSTNVMDEVGFGLDNRKTIVPILFENCTVPLRLRRIQYVDFRHDYQLGIEALLRHLTIDTTRSTSNNFAESESIKEAKPGEDLYKTPATFDDYTAGCDTALSSASHVIANETNVIMPELPELINDADCTLTFWHKHIGDLVNVGEPLFEVSSRKIDAEIPSPASGTLAEIKVPRGSAVRAKMVVALISGIGTEST